MANFNTVFCATLVGLILLANGVNGAEGSRGAVEDVVSGARAGVDGINDNGSDRINAKSADGIKANSANGGVIGAEGNDINANGSNGGNASDGSNANGGAANGGDNGADGGNANGADAESFDSGISTLSTPEFPLQSDFCSSIDCGTGSTCLQLQPCHTYFAGTPDPSRPERSTVCAVCDPRPTNTTTSKTAANDTKSSNSSTSEQQTQTDFCSLVDCGKGSTCLQLQPCNTYFAGTPDPSRPEVHTVCAVCEPRSNNTSGKITAINNSTNTGANVTITPERIVTRTNTEATTISHHTTEGNNADVTVATAQLLLFILLLVKTKEYFW